MSKHTPGPWKFGKEGAIEYNDVQNYICGADETLIVYGQVKDADARLISAAPDLLEACRAMLDCCYDMDRNDETLAAVKATMKAIAKATGEIK